MSALTFIERMRIDAHEAKQKRRDLDEYTDYERASAVCAALDEAIEELRLPHGDAGEDRACASLDGFPCDCGADAHNATLDRLRAMLDEVTT